MAAQNRSWRDREAAGEPRGLVLDPKREPVPGLQVFSTAYVPGHLLISGATDEAGDLLTEAGAELGWEVELETIRTDQVNGQLTRARIVQAPKRRRDDEPVPPIDAWRLLQQARRKAIEQKRLAARGVSRSRGSAGADAARMQAAQQSAEIKRDISLEASRELDPRHELDEPQRPPRHVEDPRLRGVGLDHVLTVDPIGLNPHGRTNPHGQTNPHGRTNAPHGQTNPAGIDGYAYPGTGGLEIVTYIGPVPPRAEKLPKGARRPVVAFVDTGCGEIPGWLPAETGSSKDIVRRRLPSPTGGVIGIDDPSTDPEKYGDQSGPLDGFLDAAAGHGTFVAGIIRQIAPDADLISVRVADSNGSVIESEFIEAIEELATWVEADSRRHPHKIDVLNLSLGYYHETPEDGHFSLRLHEALCRLRRQGCVIVCSAGNDATDRPTFPAALWKGGDPDLNLREKAGLERHLAVGALNPQNTSVALYSNVGDWVTTYAPGTSVVSVFPHLEGGVQPGSKSDRYERRRQSLDPDDHTGGFAIWSGTSFAAPFMAGMIAKELSTSLMAGKQAKIGASNHVARALAAVAKIDRSRKDKPTQ